MPVRSMQLRIGPLRWRDGVIKCGVCFCLRVSVRAGGNGFVKLHVAWLQTLVDVLVHPLVLVRAAHHNSFKEPALWLWIKGCWLTFQPLWWWSACVDASECVHTLQMPNFNCVVSNVQLMTSFLGFTDINHWGNHYNKSQINMFLHTGDPWKRLLRKQIQTKCVSLCSFLSLVVHVFVCLNPLWLSALLTYTWVHQ